MGLIKHFREGMENHFQALGVCIQPIKLHTVSVRVFISFQFQIG